MYVYTYTIYIHTLTIHFTYTGNRLKAGRIRVAQARNRASAAAPARSSSISDSRTIGSSLGISLLELSGHVGCRNNIDSSSGSPKLDRSVLYQQESSNNNTQRLYDTNTTTTGTTNANIFELSQLQATTTPGKFSNINSTDEGTLPRKSVHQSSHKTVSIRFPKEYVPLHGAESSFVDSPCPTEQIGGGSNKGKVGLGGSVEGSHGEVVGAEVTTSSGGDGEVVVDAASSSTALTTDGVNNNTSNATAEGEEGGDRANTTGTRTHYPVAEPDNCSIDV